ncbi:MAG: hypothetical protein ABS920_15165, partial [Sporosarcina sp.]
ASLYNEREQNAKLLDLLSYTKSDQLDNPLLDAFQAYAYEREEQFDDAYVSYGKAYVGLKDDHEFLDSYANFLLEEGKSSEAIEIVKELVTLVPDEEN